MIIIGYTVMCFIFGTTFLAIKIGIDAGAAPFMSAGLRFFLAGVIIYSVLFFKKKARLSLLFQKEMVITGFCLTFGTFATLYWAEQYISSGIAAILSATGPIMILLLGKFVLRYKTSKLAILGCLIGFIGVIVLLLPSFSFEVSLFWFIGCVLILIGEIGYASGTLYSRNVIVRFKETSPIALNAAQMVIGGLMLILLSFFTETMTLESLGSWNSIGSLVYLIIFGSMIGHSLYYWLVAKTDPLFPSTWLYISPLIAIVLGVVFYQEKMSGFMWVGVITIIIGVVLVNFSGLKILIKRISNVGTHLIKKRSLQVKSSK
ncbi:DMT family transporter [Litchfieldia salsa]|uniref:EamA-like transporter family protein n=1 Tax=Litchfieldia salsa TaxID=930152 RepID=A0A1H0RRB8_9BACI|nr:EamA family transporter [Litchfieldia salsa]SDP32072.1 EamA-like transporter family protein [Litchfieldia salsa]